MAAAEKTLQGGYDPGRRRRSVRTARERGCWVYIPAEELIKTGVSVFADPPLYRVWGRKRGSVLIRVYKEGEQ